MVDQMDRVLAGRNEDVKFMYWNFIFSTLTSSEILINNQASMRMLDPYEKHIDARLALVNRASALQRRVIRLGASFASCVPPIITSRLQEAFP